MSVLVCVIWEWFHRRLPAWLYGQAVESVVSCVLTLRPPGTYPTGLQKTGSSRQFCTHFSATCTDHDMNMPRRHQHFLSPGRGRVWMMLWLVRACLRHDGPLLLTS